MNSLCAVAPVATSSKVLQKNDVIDELLASCSTCSSSKNEMRMIFVREFYNYSVFSTVRPSATSFICSMLLPYIHFGLDLLSNVSFSLDLYLLHLKR